MQKLPPLAPIDLKIPIRPPRNPARMSSRPSTITPKPHKKSDLPRPPLSTGPREEVTPWELYAPDAPLFRSKISPAAIEDIIPWELHPPPPLPEPPAPTPSRKSIGTNGAKSRPNALQRIAKSVANPLSTPKDSRDGQLKFSTADRTILEELKRNISARAAQFVLKPSTSPVGRKHHPFSPADAPYPRNYEREVTDLDVWETVFCQDMCQSVTWHVFESPPAKVLDLGCGTGTWILNCARAWKHSQFVGLDLVPLQPDLQQVGSSDWASRITWVHANFLDGLPFPNEEFDFVHVKRIALGVPEDKWDHLLEEVTRVMKPGAAFEMMEEELFFPGKPYEEEDESDTDIESISSEYHGALEGFSPTTPTTVATFPRAPSRPCSPLPSAVREMPIQEDEEDPEPPTIRHPYGPPVRSKPSLQLSTPTSTTTLHVPFRQAIHSAHTGSSVSLTGSFTGKSDSPSEDRRLSSTFMHPPRSPAATTTSFALASTQLTPKATPFLLRTLAKPPVNPRDHSILEYIYTEMLSSRFINSSPLSLLGETLGLHFRDLRTHPPLQYTFPPSRPRQQTKDTGHDAHLNDSDSDSEGSDGAKHAIVPGLNTRKRSTKSLQSSNTSRPRSSTGISRRQSSEHSGAKFAGTVSFSQLEARLTARDLQLNQSPYVILDDDRMGARLPGKGSQLFTVGEPGLGKKQQPAVTSSRNGDASTSGVELKPRPAKQLPNQTLNIDVRTLNLHLKLRTAEIVACRDALWEWVVDTQAAAQASKMAEEKDATRRERAGSMESRSARSLQRPARSPSFKSEVVDPEEYKKMAVLDLTAEDFDGLVERFEMDMSDQFSLSSALEERFSWKVFPSQPSAERKIFDAACEKWEAWEREEQERQATPRFMDRRPQPPTTSSSSLHTSSRHRTNGSISGDLADHGHQHQSQRGHERVDESRPPHDGEESSRPQVIRRAYSTQDVPTAQGGHHSHRLVSHSQADLKTKSRTNGTLSPISNHSFLPPRKLSRAVRVFVAWKA